MGKREKTAKVNWNAEGRRISKSDWKLTENFKRKNGIKNRVNQ